MKNPDIAPGGTMRAIDIPSSKNVDERFEKVIENFDAIADKPHHPKMASFYRAVHELVSDNNVSVSFLKIALQRDITPAHFSNLFLRAVNYVEIFERGRTEYTDDFLEPNTWKKELVGKNGIITNHLEKLQELLAAKETTTTKYQRGAGVKASLNALFPNKPVKIADFGCGANYLLRGLMGNIPFQDNITYAANLREHLPTITRLINNPVDIVQGLAIDKNLVDGEEERKWRIACNFYPDELTQKALQDTRDLDARMDSVRTEGLRVIQGDLLSLEVNHGNGTLPEGQLDAVVLSTIIYQLGTAHQLKILGNSEKSLGPGGIIILNEHADKDTTSATGIRLRNDWTTPFTYGTFIKTKGPDTQWLEFLRWGNGRCKEVKAGEDFEKVMSMNS